MDHVAQGFEALGALILVIWRAVVVCARPNGPPTSGPPALNCACAARWRWGWRWRWGMGPRSVFAPKPLV